MSDMYQVLRSRLPSVTPREWIHVPTGVLREARRRRRLSYEAVARELHVSSKTYERYEKDGRLPEELIGLACEILGIEVVTPDRQDLRLQVRPRSADELMLEAMARLEEKIDLLQRRVDQLSAQAGLADLRWP